MKKTISMLLALLLLVSIIPTAAATASPRLNIRVGDTEFKEEHPCDILGNTTQSTHASEKLNAAELPFTDVPKDSWYYEDALFAYQNGILAGTSATTFSPTVNVTKEMLVAVLWRHAGCPEATIDGSLSDVPPGKWYTECCYWAAKNMIVYSDGANRFGVGKPVSRAELCEAFYNYATFYLKLNTSGRYPESDATDLDDVAWGQRSAILWAMSAGVMYGKGGGRMDPFGKTSRAEFAALYHRFTECKMFEFDCIFICSAPDNVEYDRETGLCLDGLEVRALDGECHGPLVTDYRVFVTDNKNPVHPVQVSWGGMNADFFAAATSNTGKYDIDALQGEMNDYLRTLGFRDIHEIDMNKSTWPSGDCMSGHVIDILGGVEFFRDQCRKYADFVAEYADSLGGRENWCAYAYLCYDKSSDNYDIHVFLG